MTGHVRLAFHESGHVLTALRFGRKVDRVSISAVGGSVKEEAFAPDATTEQIREGLVVTFAGREAERFAPEQVPAASSNGGMSPMELEALATIERDLASAPSDEQILLHYEERVGAETVEEARALAREFVARSHATGALERIADELLWRQVLTGDEVVAILDAPTA